MDVIRVGDINSDSFEQLPNKIRYAYTLEKNDVKLKVVVDEYNDGKKIFDYYSDRNFIDYNNKTRVDTDMAAISKNNQKVSVKNNYLQGFLYISIYVFICFKIYIKFPFCRFFYIFLYVFGFFKILYNGARGRTRTDTRLPLSDFESDASTSFTTRAKLRLNF